MSSLSRRTLLAALGPLSLTASPALLAAAATPAAGTKKVLRLFSPLQYGAKANGKDLDTRAINAAVDACFQEGGGIVYVAPGRYLCGSIVLKSNVTLYLEAGATLLGSKEIGDYTNVGGGPSNNGDTGSRHLIFARGAENVGIAGPGTVDGQGESYWKPSGIPPLAPENAWADVIARSYAEKGERPSPMIEFVECKWVRVEDTRIQQAASWTMRLVDCEEVQIRGVSIRNPVYGHNTDGIDITGCTNLFISDCSIDTGDDTICIKSQAPYGGRPRLTKNIVITNCVLTTCSNGFKIGTATEWGVENITFSNSIIYNNEVEYKYRVVSGIAIDIGRWRMGRWRGHLEYPHAAHANPVFHPHRRPQPAVPVAQARHPRRQHRQCARGGLGARLLHHGPAGCGGARGQPLAPDAREQLSLQAGVGRAHGAGERHGIS